MQKLSTVPKWQSDDSKLRSQAISGPDTTNKIDLINWPLNYEFH